VERDLANRSAYLLLIGESGAGKSSLARAAVLPRILRLTGEGAGRSDVWRVARLSASAAKARSRSLQTRCSTPRRARTRAT
jgi:ABC-type oligopeptide transport system ATPase subunit